MPKALEMRHMDEIIHELGLELKAKFWPVLNEASKEAVYNVCVVHSYTMDDYGNKRCEQIGYHTDTKPHRQRDLEHVPNVKGAAVLVVSYGMPMNLYTRRITTPLYAKTNKCASQQCPAAELVHGSAYVWEAGEEGSADWLFKHAVCPHPEGHPGEERVSIIFRALDQANSRWYHTSRFPYCMCEAEL
jgi:hypothetical protein